MDDQPTLGVDFGDWFLWWLDLVGEFEEARERMIDDDIKVTVLLKETSQGAQRSPRAQELTATDANKFLVMSELVQHWCRSRRTFCARKPPMEIAAVSTTVGDSGATVSALAWYESW